MITETSSVRFGGTRREYGVLRSARRRTVAVAVDPEDGVLLTAPENLSLQKLDDVVRGKAPWILERLRWVEQPEGRLVPCEYTSGESFLSLGRQFRLKVARASASPGVRLSAGFLHVRPGRSQDRLQRAHVIRRAIRAWYRERAAERLVERVAIWSGKLDVPTVGSVLVRAQLKRWASCDALGNLRFNWRVVQAPMRLLDYVVAHELVHLVHRDHTAKFWRRLGAGMADYETRREDLRLLGPRLEW